MKHRPCGNGKGDTPRPIQDREKFDSNWDAIFGKDVKAAAKRLSDHIDNEALKELNKDKQDAEVDRNNPMPDRDSTNKS